MAHHRKIKSFIDLIFFRKFADEMDSIFREAFVNTDIYMITVNQI